MDTSSECELSGSDGEDSAFVINTQESMQDKECKFDSDLESTQEENEWSSDDEEPVNKNKMETDSYISTAPTFKNPQMKNSDDGNEQATTVPRRNNKLRPPNNTPRSQHIEVNEEIPQNHVVCELCKEAGEPMCVKHHDSFSAEVKRGKHGRHGKPFCLDHTAGVQRDCISHLERKGARQLVNAPGPPGEADDGSCFNCSKCGHWARDCPNLQQNDRFAAAGSSFRDTRAPKVGSCFRCGQPGHWVRDCPNLHGNTGIAARVTGPSFQDTPAPPIRNWRRHQQQRTPRPDHTRGACCPNFNPPLEETNEDKKETVQADQEDEVEVVELQRCEWTPASKVTLPVASNKTTAANYVPHIVKIKGMKVNLITSFFGVKQ